MANFKTNREMKKIIKVRDIENENDLIKGKKEDRSHGCVPDSE